MKLLLTALAGLALATALPAQTADVTLWVTLGDSDQLVEVDPHSFQVVDARSGRITGQIPIGNDPNQMTLTRDGRFAYVPVQGDNAVAVVQLDPLRLVKTLPSPAGPHDATTSPDGTRIYVGAQYGAGIVEIDPATQLVVRTIPTPEGVRPLRPSPDGKSLYVALSNLLGFAVVDAGSGTITRRVELGTLPEGVPAPYKDTWLGSGPKRIAIGRKPR